MDEMDVVVVHWEGVEMPSKKYQLPMGSKLLEPILTGFMNRIRSRIIFRDQMPI